MQKLKLENPSYRLLISKYKEWMDVLGYCKGSLKYYPIHLQEFFHWLETHNYQNLEVLTSSIIKTYYSYLKERPNQNNSGALSKASLNGHIASLRLFNEYLKKHNAKALPIHLRIEKREVLTRDHIYTQAEIKQLFEAAEYCSSKEYARLRDKAILVCLYSCGMRRNEAVNLDVEDILFDKERIYIRKGKNYKERFVPLNTYNLRILEEYIYDGRYRYSYADQSDALFVSHYTKRIGGQSLKLRLRALLNATGDEELIIKGITPHRLRHSIATHLMEQGVPIEAISQFLGHSTLESTQIYTHITSH